MLDGDSGRLQLAGAVMFSDGQQRAAREGERDPDAPEHMAPRAIDYSSSCSLLVRAQTWDTIGGADELMFPGGYVDADLGMAAWAAGWTVRYEPSAVVRHRHLGTMTGGFKAFTHGRNRGSLPPQVGGRAGAARAVGAGRGGRRGESRRARGGSRRAGARPWAAGGAGRPRGRRRIPISDRAWPRSSFGCCREYVATLDPELERLHREYALEREERLKAQAALEAMHQRQRSSS